MQAHGSAARAASKGTLLQKKKHVTYWLRCLRTYLPTAYTEYDTQRMTLAFFTLSALDLLSVLHDEDVVSAQDRGKYVEWVYTCQHPRGGFLPAPVQGNDTSEVQNLAATFFALAALMVLGDGLERVDEEKCLHLVRKLQLPNGSFGEFLSEDGIVFGGDDIRYCYFAAGIRWILRRGSGMDKIQDIDTKEVADFVRASVTYDGGIAKQPLHEAHAGWTFCGIATLKFLHPSPQAHAPFSDAVLNGILHWLVSRQTIHFHEDDPRPPNITLHEVPKAFECAGFSGRCNKIADTCYAFWIGGSLAMLGKTHIQDFAASQEYLLSQTQHIIGGFGKVGGDPPDMMHSYLGLAALATLRCPEVRSVDPMLCMSVRAVEDYERR